MTYSTKSIEKIQKLIKRLFKNASGDPFEATPEQARMFLSILDPHIKWLWLTAPTRYGKSEILAMALLYLAAVKKLKLPIAAGSMEKANKIMEYVLQHISDHHIFFESLINMDLSDVEKLKVRMTKEVMRWSHGGWIFITSVESKNTVKEGEGVVGEGGDVVTLEEAGLIKREEQYSKIVRMAEENRGWGKLIMSGNCIEGSIFHKASKDPMFVKVWITLDIAIAEGRFTQAALDQKKTQTTAKDWKRYYLTQFPDVNEFTYFKPIKFNLLPPNLKYFGAMDPALGESKKGSKIGISVVGLNTDNSIRYEVETIIEHMLPDEAVRRVFNMPYKFDKFVIESVMFQQYFLKVTNEKSKELGRGISFEGIKQSKNKNVRIESMEPDINNGRVLFKGDNQLWQDMQDYPNTEYLDGLDALQMALEASAKPSAKVAIGDDVF